MYLLYWLSVTLLQAVEHYTSLHNAKIQRDDDQEEDTSSEDFDEHRELLGEAMKEQLVT